MDSKFNADVEYRISLNLMGATDVLTEESVANATFTVTSGRSLSVVNLSYYSHIFRQWSSGY